MTSHICPASTPPKRTAIAWATGALCVAVLSLGVMGSHHAWLHYSLIHELDNGGPDSAIHVVQLVRMGANVNTRGSSGYTPLIITAGGGDLPAVRELLARGADVNAQSRSGFDALMHAASRGNVAVVRTLLSHGAHVNGFNKRGDTALSLARKKELQSDTMLRQDYAEIVALLRKAGARN